MEGRQKSEPLRFPLILRQDLDGELHQVEKEEEEEEGYFCRGEEIIEQAMRQVCLAGPLIGVSLLQYSLQVISIMFVGHLGELSLSSASMATSFASVTGFSVLLGMGSALETLCGQAYGIKQYHMLGIHTQRAMLTLLALTIHLAGIWFYTTIILTDFSQDHEISIEAGTFNCWMIPSLFAYALLQCLNRFLQAQNVVVPMMINSGSQLCFMFFCVGFL